MIAVPPGSKAAENLALGVGDAGFIGEIFDMRRCDPGDDGDCRAYLLGQAAISPAWFMPISKMPKRLSAGIRARLSGTPVWLL